MYHISKKNIFRKGSLLLITLATVNLSCSDKNEEDYVYPSLITEMADMHTDSEAKVTHFVTDNGDVFYTNTKVGNTKADTTYRVMCGYVKSDNKDRYADILTLENVEVLRKVSAASPDIHPVNAISVWRGGEYINMRLEPKTQGGEHYWGYVTDSIKNNSNGKTYHISLWHNQGEDPMYYSRTVYASLPLKENTEGISKGDSITLYVHTFDGIKSWNFEY